MDRWDENVSNVRFVAWDTETTGLSPSDDHLVEIAAVAFDEEFEQRRFHTMVRPPSAIPPAATAIHGITDAMVGDAPVARDAIASFLEFLGWSGTPRALVAHNAGFDVGFVRARLGDGPVERVSEVVIDSCMLARNLVARDTQDHKLETLCRRFGVIRERGHRALDDALALREVFLRLLGLAADRAADRARGLTLGALVDLAGGYFTLDRRSSECREFRLAPRLEAIERLCGTQARLPIAYEREGDWRHITPLEVRLRGLRVYVDAFCHRDNARKTFRADRIVEVGRPQHGPDSGGVEG